MAKVSVTPIANLSSTTSISNINTNFEALADAVENTLSRDGTAPNQMDDEIDMNSNRIVNLPAAIASTEPVRKNEFDAVVADLEDAAANAAIAAAAAASAAADAATVSATVSGATPSVQNFNGDAVTVSFNLGVTPAENNTYVFVDGVYQQKNTYSISGTSIVFTTAPPTGTNNIEVVLGATTSLVLQDSADVSHTSAATGGIVRNLKQKSDDAISVKDFGATGDGVTDDTAAIQAAIDSGEDIYFPAGTYSFTTLTMDNAGQSFTGSSIARAVAGGARLVTAETSGVAVSVEAADVVIENLWIEGPGRASGLGHIVYVERPGTTAADLDFSFINSFAGGADVAVEIVGRGAFFYNSLFTDTRYHIKLDFPSTISAATAFGNDSVGGPRKYRIKDCYFHSASTASIGVVGTEADSIYGVEVTGCLQDDVQRFWIGPMKRVTMVGNTVHRCDANVITLQTHCQESVISGNSFSGDPADSSAFTLARVRAFLLIEASCSVRGLTFTNNNCSWNRRSCIQSVALSTISNSVFSGNTFEKVCLENDSRTDDIFEIEGSIVDSVVSDNVADTDGMANNGSAYFFNRTGSASHSRLFGSNNVSPGDFGGVANGLLTTTLPSSIGGRCLWTDSTGDMRISAPYPTTDTDGVVLGTQS